MNEFADYIYEIVIPDFLPTSLNKLLRMHWSKRLKVQQSEWDLIAYYCAGSDNNPGIRRALAPDRRRRVHLQFEHTGKRPPDPDNLLKTVIDGLVKCGRLVDDSQKWLDLETPTVVRGPRRRTVILMEDV